MSNFGHTIHGGTVATQGAASYDNGVWWVATDGANIWFDTDDCTFLHQELPGVTDVTISATIQGGTGGQYAGYGLLIRDGDADGANEVSWRSQQGGSLTVQYRNADNPDSWYMGFPSSPLPVQLRLQKRGDLFTAYQFQGGRLGQHGQRHRPHGSQPPGGYRGLRRRLAGR